MTSPHIVAHVADLRQRAKARRDAVRGLRGVYADQARARATELEALADAIDGLVMQAGGGPDATCDVSSAVQPGDCAPLGESRSTSPGPASPEPDLMAGELVDLLLKALIEREAPYELTDQASHTRAQIFRVIAEHVANLREEVADATKRLPRSHERFVRCAPEFVEQLKAASSDPITVRIEERAHGELYFEATRHECPPPRPTLTSPN